MRKIQTIFVALFALFAFGAIVASSAFAETTLPALFLVNGKHIEGAEKIEATVTGPILLEDTETIAGKAAVLCEGTLVEGLEAEGKATILAVLNLTGPGEEIGELGGLALKCAAETGCAAASETSPIEVWPVGLKEALVEVYLMENGQFLFLLTPMKGTVIGYELLCLILGLNTEDTCTATMFDGLLQNNVEGDVISPTGSTFEPNANCTQSGGKATGINETEANTPVVGPMGELISVSSE